jgi:uncharacterized protein
MTPSSWRASLLAEQRSVLIVALSARSLALAARRAGYRPIVIDLFGDTDTRRYAAASAIVPGELAHGFDAAALIAAAERLARAGDSTAGLVYGSGLEARPDLLAALARGRPLWGNPPGVLHAIKDPATFFALLDRLDLPHPEVRPTPPGDLEAWLAKHAGGSGGGHVRPAADGEAGGEGVYYQRIVPGRPISCLFLADGRRGVVLGWSEQWASSSPGHPFRFGGAVQPAAPDPRVVARIAAALPALVEATRLVGLNSIDMMLGENGAFSLLEINPRPGASLDIFDGEGEGALFGRHVAACEGHLVAGWRRPARATAMTVVYADRPLDVPVEASWPGWLADRPAPGAHIAAGAPVCTVMAEASSAAAARALATARNRGVLEALASGNLELLDGSESPPGWQTAMIKEGCA